MLDVCGCLARLWGTGYDVPGMTPSARRVSLAVDRQLGLPASVDACVAGLEVLPHWIRSGRLLDDKPASGPASQERLRPRVLARRL